MKLLVNNANIFSKGYILRFDRDNRQYIVTRVWGGDTLLKRLLRIIRIKIPIHTLKVKVYDPKS